MWRGRLFYGIMNHMKKINKNPFVFLISLLFISGAVPARGAVSYEVVSVIRENCAGQTRCYTSLKAWEESFGGINFNEVSNTCTNGDLTCLEKSAIVRIEGEWKNPDTLPVVIRGWTTSSKYFIKIYTASEARHKGVWDGTKYRLVVAQGDGITVDERHVRLEGLQIQLNSSEPASAGIRMDVSAISDVRVSSNIIRGNSASGMESGGILASTDSGIGATYTIFNNIIYDFLPGKGASGIKTYLGTWRILNNTLFNNTVGIHAAYLSNEEILLKNNVAQKSVDGFLGNFHADSQNNISDLAGDAPGTNSKNSISAKFVDEAVRNLHLSGSDTQAKDAGVNLSSGEAFSFEDDIDGETRGTLWDVGADETFLEPTSEEKSSDATPPEISGGAPSGSQESGAREATISVKTNENATCKYSKIPDIGYDSMLETFDTTGGRVHTSSVSGLLDGNTYTYFVRCKDELGNMNAKDYPITFSVASVSITPEPTPTPTPAEEKNDSDNDGLSDSDEYLSGTQKDNADTDGDGVSDGEEIARKTDPLNPATLKKPSSKFLSSARGRILLQVQRRGEAWYMNPVDSRRYFLRDGASAYEIMRKLGLGITNANLAKISEVGSPQKGDAALVSRLKGRILLQVESRGEAWYVNPVDGKRYYLKDGPTAYELMRKLGMGVYTSDLITLSYSRL